MNIVLDSNLLLLKGIDREGKFFIVEDNIGFSTGHGVQGFNNVPDHFEDTLGEDYPPIHDIALIMYARYNKAVGGPIPIIPTGDIVKPPLSVRCMNYDEVKHSYVFPIQGDGWYTIYGIILPLNSGESFYYQVSTGLIKTAGGALTLTTEQALEEKGIQHTQTDIFISPSIERELANKIGDLTDIGMTKGRDDPRYQDLLKAVLFVDTQLVGSYIKFNDNNKGKAQELIENLANTNPYEFV